MTPISTHDKRVLQDLARRWAEIGHSDVMDKRRREWKRHHRMDRGRPMILIFPEGSWGELLPAGSLKCEDSSLHGIEWELRHRVYTWEHFDSDNVIDPVWTVHKTIRNSGWGIEAQHQASTTHNGAWGFSPVINSEADLDKLRHPVISHDSEATERDLQRAHEIFDGILPIQVKGVTHISFHLMAQYTGWRGLEQVMVDMIEVPEMLHRAMSILEEGHRHMIRQYEELNLLSTNNDNTYHSSGGIGHLDGNDIFAEGFNPDRVRPCDMWASAESQELTMVRPKMHVEFAMEYEKRLLEPFALTGYGCCDDFTRKIPDILTIPHIRRISVSPFSQLKVCAPAIGRKAIVSWKPHPSHLVGEFNADLIRQTIREGLELSRDNNIEIILKDTHTCENHPERFDQWSRIAREEVERFSN